MTHSIVSKLMDSFQELERSVHIAKRAVWLCNPVPLTLVNKVQEFEETLEAQRRLTQRLNDELNQGRFTEVARSIRMISGYTSMIQEDARAIVADLISNEDDPTPMNDKPIRSAVHL